MRLALCCIKIYTFTDMGNRECIHMCVELHCYTLSNIHKFFTHYCISTPSNILTRRCRNYILHLENIDFMIYDDQILFIAVDHRYIFCTL